jgi:hypothetical protein
MRAAINLVGLALWFPLIVLLIARLLAGEWRRYPLVFVYVLVDFLGGVADAPTVWAVYRHVPNALLNRAGIWEKVEILSQFLLFAVVLSLISRATAQLQSRNLVRGACIVGAVLFVGVSFALHYDPQVNSLAWITPWTRDLNVCTTILDLALWLLLLASREKDYRLFLLSGALGIQFTGAAIGNSLRTLASRPHPWPSLIGGIIVLAAGLIRIYVWARAFRTVTAPGGSALARAGLEPRP